MKAMVYTEYGSPEVLKLKEVEKPTPKDDEVLIKVRAANVTTGDVNMRGFLFVPPGFGPLPRLMFGWNKPKKPILGVELAGDVVAVGKDVTEFKVGDAVFGIDSNAIAAYAEYACRREKTLAHKPENLSYEEAASVNFGAGTALFFLRDKAKVKSGQKVLVNGASGGVGAFAVQIAKYYGAEVTAVCSGRNADFVKSLGADHVIDYTKTDFTTTGEQYDIICDTVCGKTSFARSKKALKPKGLYLPIAGGPKEIFQALWTSIRGGKKVIAGPPPESKDDLLFIKGLLESGDLKPVIDRCYPFEEMVEAHRYVDTGRKRGSVVVSMAS